MEGVVAEVAEVKSEPLVVEPVAEVVAAKEEEVKAVEEVKAEEVSNALPPALPAASDGAVPGKTSLSVL
jgi:hypothetical protein